MDYEILNMEYGIRNVECVIRNMDYGICNMECGMWTKRDICHVSGAHYGVATVSRID